MEKEYLDIISKNILTKVKENIKKNYIILEKKQELITDQKILEVIKSIVDDKKENIDNQQPHSYLMSSLMQYYTAIYNDNLDLLHTLLNNNFDWECTKHYEMNLFVLDKRISNNFESNEYLKMLNNNMQKFKYFYKSLYYSKDNPEINQNEIIKKFSNVIKHESNTQKTENTSFDRELKYLNITTLINFTEQEILNLTKTQKEMLNYAEHFNKDIIVNLIKNYNYSKNLICWSKFKEYFTIEEILNLTDNDIKQYKEIFGTYYYEKHEQLEQNAIAKIKQIKESNPNFSYVLDAIVYDVLTPEQIMSLSKTGNDLINSICSSYVIHNADRYSEKIPEKILRFWIKEAYYKGKIKNSIKKLTRQK